MRKSNKEIINDIRREGKSFTPDVLHNVYKAIGVDPVVIGKEEKAIEQRLIDEAERFVPKKNIPTLTPALSTPRPSLRTLLQRPRFVSLMATAMVGVILTATMITLGVNGFFIGTPTDTSSSGNTITVPQPIQNDQQVFSVGALTSNVLFDFVEQSSIESAVKTLANPPAKDGDIILPQISPYLEMLEQLLSSEGQFDVISEYSDRAKYDFKETFIAYDAFGENMNYVIYYNVNEFEEDEDEATYRFTGIIAYQESQEEYSIEGRREIDQDSVKVSMIINYNVDYYVYSEYITEGDVTKYRFRFYEDDFLISDSNLKLEITDEKLKLTLSFEDESDEFRYMIDKDIEDPTIIHVNYQIKQGESPTRAGQIDIHIVENENGEVEYIIIVKPEGGDEDERREDRGHGHGHGEGQGGGQGGGPGGGGK